MTSTKRPKAERAHLGASAAGTHEVGGPHEEAQRNAHERDEPSTISTGLLPAAPASRARASGQAPAAAPIKPPTKLAQMRALLGHTEGATLAELQQATGWQAHSVQAALSGLRKAGVEVERSRTDAGGTAYRIVSRTDAAAPITADPDRAAHQAGDGGDAAAVERQP